MTGIRPSLAAPTGIARCLVAGTTNKMDASHLAYIQANPGKPFCLGCLARLSTPIHPAEATHLLGCSAED